MRPLVQAMLVLVAAAVVFLTVRNGGICGRDNDIAWLVPLAGVLTGAAVWMGVRRLFRRQAVAVAASVITAAGVIVGTYFAAVVNWVGHCTA